MKNGIYTRLIAWVVLVVLPASVASTLVVVLINTRLNDRIDLDLVNTRRLEAARIQSTLDKYRSEIELLANREHVQQFVTAYHNRPLAPEIAIVDIDGFEPVDITSDQPLHELAKKLLLKSSLASPHVHALRLLGTDGVTLGSTINYSWQPYEPDIFLDVQESRSAQFGNAFRSSGDYELLGVAAPIYSDSGRVVGVLLAEMHLAPIVNLITAHEGMGETSEGHIAQLTPNGDAEFVTLLRFERDAAFRKIVSKAKNLPINQSLQSPVGQVVRSPDYRGVDSILAIETLDDIGWGLVIKIDTDEALAPAAEIRNIILAAAALTGIFISLGCLFFLRPLSRRMRRLASATEMVANRQFDFTLNDASSDEIGRMADQLDDLASELATGTSIGVAIQEQLRFKDSHDELTEVLNRSALFEYLDNLTDVSSSNPTSVLALDLSGMESVNAAHGRDIGDALLVDFAHRLLEAAPPKSSVARWNGDLFVIVAPNCDLPSLQGTVARLKHMLEHGLESGGKSFPGQFSYGLSTAYSNNEVGTLLKKSMDALDHWKTVRKSHSKTSNTAITIVEQAIKNKRVSVWYQPVVRLSDTRNPVLVFAEAFTRISDESGKLIPPNDLFPHVDKHAAGARLDRSIVGNATRQLVSWKSNRQTVSDFGVSINLTNQSQLSEEMLILLRQLSINHSELLKRMVLEIPSSSMSEQIETLTHYQSLGIKIAIDDKGAEDFSVNQLVKLRPALVKIDSNRLIDKHQSSKAMTSENFIKLLDFFRSLGIDIIAKNVESADQLELLQHQGVQMFQGYYFDAPMAGEEFIQQWGVGGDQKHVA